MLVSNIKSWRKQAVLINIMALYIVLLLLIQQVNTEGVNIKLDMEEDASKASKEGKIGGIALLSQNPPAKTNNETLTNEATTKATTSKSQKKEARKGRPLMNAMHKLQNLAGYYDVDEPPLTPEEKKEIVANFFGMTFLLMLAGCCCCCVCYGAIFYMIIKAAK
uniref:Uncharacterized protein n=1 Tax=Meloidogyne hapla TaxID=6305 RepID=A0A1I8B148_MELHA